MLLSHFETLFSKVIHYVVISIIPQYMTSLQIHPHHNFKIISSVFPLQIMLYSYVNCGVIYCGRLQLFIHVAVMIVCSGPVIWRAEDVGHFSTIPFARSIYFAR